MQSCAVSSPSSASASVRWPTACSARSSTRARKLAEQGGRLSVVDPAFKPMRPSGPGKTIFLLAGMVLFLGLGGALAIGLAIIDDRLYRREDLDVVGVPVLAVIPAMHVVSKRGKHGA